MASKRNRKCFCGSGRKFKHCCLDKIPKARDQFLEITHIDKPSLMARIRAWNKSHHPIKNAIEKIKIKCDKPLSWIKLLPTRISAFFKSLF